MTAVELLPLGEATPDNPRWHELRRTGVTASEIAVVMGLSKWDSPFNLYWSKVNGWSGEDSEIMATGRHLEASIADWWQATNSPDHPVIHRAGLYAHADRPWQLATPDRLMCDPQMHDNPFPENPSFQYEHPVANVMGLLECKWVAQSWDGWGEEGTDQIPVYYRCQGLWQADTLGVDEVHFAVLGPTGFRAYLVRRDEAGEADLKLMRDAAEDFVRRLKEQDPPDLDSHSATIDALRKLHPSVGQGDVEVSVELAERYRIARLERDDAKARVALCEAEIRDALGSEFNRAVVGKRLVASRSIFERTSEDEDELHALDDGWPITDRLNPGKKLEVPYA